MQKMICVGLIMMMSCAAAIVSAKEITQIRWGVDGDYPPFGVMSKGKVVGFDPDIAQAICNDLKAQCVFVNETFDNMIKSLQANKFDAVISSMSVTKERLQLVDFTHKYYSSTMRLVARKGSDLYPMAKFLVGKTISVQAGSTHEKFAKERWAKAGQVKILSHENMQQVYDDLISGRADATLQDSIQAEANFLNTKQGQGFEFAGPKIGRPGSLAIAVRKTDPELKAAINQSLKNIRKNGVYDTIRQKYFATDIY